MVVIGIDIGLTGAVAAVDHRGTGAVHDMPIIGKDGARRIDGRALFALLRQLAPAGEPCSAVFEDVRPRPMGNGGAHGNSMHSQGSLMRSRGIVEAVLDVARIEQSTVQPQTWKRHYALLKAEKDASLQKARLLYPTLCSSLARVKDHNRAEALLIAHWALGEAA